MSSKLPSSPCRAAAIVIIAGCCYCACDVTDSGFVIVEAGRGQKKEKRPPSPPSQTQEREGARGRGACYRSFYRRRTPLPPMRSAAVAVVGVLVAAAAKPVQRPPLFHFLSLVKRNGFVDAFELWFRRVEFVIVEKKLV
ncbi:uncharacterized protein DS421_19g665390 [Arachis hypogaea]|uniref:Secreted protein n=1 Tax=Arachis hypogaea TaxID=3818 RepID=A0A6B9VAN0_ARAHY|nr:uncharacterized protein DS421_19g665390 [Arachis hypogaea]